MFDLFRRRDKAVRIVLGAMMLLIAASMVTYLIPGGTLGNQSGQDTVIAEVGKQSVTVADFQQRMEVAQRNKAIPPGAGPIFAQQMLDQMIAAEALDYEARQRLGIVITDADVVASIRARAPQLFPNGQFVGRDVYASFLAQQNMTIPEFESQLRRELLLNRITSLIIDNVVVTPEEVVRDYQHKQQRVKLDYVEVVPGKASTQVSITPDEMKTYFNAFQSQYRVPERRNFQMLVIDAAQVSQRVNLTDDQLRHYYDQNKDQFRTPERVHVRHILLKTTDKAPGQVAGVEAKAEDLLKQIKGGANFADLAKKSSEDPGSGAKGGDLGWIVRDQTVKAFENAAFSLKPNELSGVIKTEYGFHIIQVLEKQDAHLKPFEEVKDQLAQERKKALSYDTMQQLADQAHDELVKHPQSAGDIARQLNIPGINVSDAVAGRPVPVFGPNPDFSDAIFGLTVGGVTPVMQAPGDKLAVAALTGITPSRAAQPSEVEDQVRAALTKLKSTNAVKQTADDLFAKVKAGGDLGAAARQMGLEVKTTQPFGPDGAADGIGSASMLAPAFDRPVGSVFGPVVIDGKQFICKVVEKVPADMTLFEAQKGDIQAALKDTKGRQQIELFIDSVRSALIRSGKIKIHQPVFDRMVAATRG